MSRSTIDGIHLVLSHRVLHGFSTVGTAVVAVILISGLINSWTLVGVTNLATLPGSLYGRLLIAKLVLFGAMVVLAAATPVSRHLIDAVAIARVKPGVMLINTSRGTVVDTRAVIGGD